MKDRTMIDGKLYEPEKIDISKPPVEEKSISIKLACVFGFILLVCLSFYLIDPVANMGRIWEAKLKAMVGMEVMSVEIRGIGTKSYAIPIEFPLAYTSAFVPDIGNVLFQDGMAAVFDGEYSVSINEESARELISMFHTKEQLNEYIGIAVRQILRIAANEVTYADMRKDPNKFSDKLKKAMLAVDMPDGITYGVILRKVSIGGAK